jgi:hypothetical protein
VLVNGSPFDVAAVLPSVSLPVVRVTYDVAPYTKEGDVFTLPTLQSTFAGFCRAQQLNLQTVTSPKRKAMEGGGMQVGDEQGAV